MSSDVTDAAIHAVNAPPLAERGYALDPAGKAQLVSPAGAPLVRILSDRSLSELVAGYERDDQAAVDAQKHCRRWQWVSIMARYGIILLGIAALSATHVLQSWLGEGLRLWLGAALALQLFLFLVALVVTFYFKRSRPFEAWMRLRSFAEVKRLAFFDCIMQRPQVATDGELPVLPLKLEFVVHYLLEPQLAYFRRRAKELGRGQGLGTFSLVVLALVIVYTLAQIVLSLAATFAGYVPPFPFDPQLAMGRALIGAAFAVLLASTTIAQVDERNALRYLQTAENLQALEAQYLPLARSAALADDHVAVDSFVRLVTEQVGFGAADWLSLDELKRIAAETKPTRPGLDIAAARRFLLALGAR